MKKLLLIATSILLFSCATNEDLEIPVNETQKVSKTELKGAKLFGGENITLKCNGSGNYTNPINLNPNYPYINNYEVLSYDLAALHGRNQITLSNFVARHVFGYGTLFQSSAEIYIGYDTMNAFYNSTVGHNSIVEYTIGQDGYNAEYYGDMFGANGIMTNDAANTVYHGCQTFIDNLTAQGKQIKAVHIYRTGLLCIPSVKYLKMTVKVL